MTAIHAKALGLHLRGTALLATEIREIDGSLKGVRPPGGTIEPGETSVDCLHREFREELDVAITITGGPIVRETIFHFRGAPGHEIVFCDPITFPDAHFEALDILHYLEDSGDRCLARWWEVGTLDTPEGPPLVPMISNLI